MKNGTAISHDSKNKIKQYFTGINDGNIILVSDMEDKIKSAFNN